MHTQSKLAPLFAELHQAMAPMMATAARINAAVAQLPRIEPPPDLLAAARGVHAAVATITRMRAPH